MVITRMENSAPSNQNVRFPRELFTLALIVVLFWGAWVAQAFLIPVSLAALLAFLTAPLVRVMCQYKVPEWLAILLSAILLLLPVAFVLFMVARQAQTLLSDYPSIVASVQKSLTQLAGTTWGQKLHLQEQLSVSTLTERLSQGASEGIQFFVHSLRTLLEAGTQFVLIFLFAILMLASRVHIFRSSKRILANFESIEAGNLLEAVTDLIEKFLLTKLIVIGIVGLLSFGLLQVFGLRYAFLLGAMTGVLTLLPEVGFVVGLVPVIAVAGATGHSWGSSTLIVGSLIGVHLIEANVLTPKLVGKSLNLNVLATFLGLFGGGLLWGVWGMLLSVPFLGVLRILLSTAPTLQPWAELLSEREDRQLTFRLMSKTFRARLMKTLLEKARQT